MDSLKSRVSHPKTTIKLGHNHYLPSQWVVTEAENKITKCVLQHVVGDPLPIVGDLLGVVGDLLGVVGDPLCVVGDPLPVVGDPLVWCFEKAITWLNETLSK